MVFASWRGIVGVVKPTHRPGSLEEFIRLLPEGIGVVPVYLNFKRGTEDEFRGALNAVEEKVAELANGRCRSDSSRRRPAVYGSRLQG